MLAVVKPLLWSEDMTLKEEAAITITSIAYNSPDTMKQHLIKEKVPAILVDLTRPQVAFLDRFPVHLVKPATRAIASLVNGSSKPTIQIVDEFMNSDVIPALNELLCLMLIIRDDRAAPFLDYAVLALVHLASISERVRKTIFDRNIVEYRLMQFLNSKHLPLRENAAWLISIYTEYKIGENVIFESHYITSLVSQLGEFLFGKVFFRNKVERGVEDVQSPIASVV